jgi:hypothetical protein
MKKILISIGLVLGIIFSAFSQNKPDYRFIVTTNIGESFLGLGYNVVNKRTIDSVGSFELSSRPVWQSTTHYFIKKWFSLGVSASTQVLNGTIYDFTYKENNVLEYVDLNFSVRRTKFGICPMFHYAQSDKIDMYSGFNIGYMISKTSMGVAIPEVKAQDLFSFKVGSRFSMQMVEYGIRYYPMKHVGLNLEFGLGSPFFISSGVQVRF